MDSGYELFIGFLESLGSRCGDRETTTIARAFLESSVTLPDNIKLSNSIGAHTASYSNKIQGVQQPVGNQPIQSNKPGPVESGNNRGTETNIPSPVTGRRKNFDPVPFDKLMQVDMCKHIIGTESTRGLLSIMAAVNQAAGKTVLDTEHCVFLYREDTPAIIVVNRKDTVGRIVLQVSTKVDETSKRLVFYDKALIEVTDMTTNPSTVIKGTIPMDTRKLTKSVECILKYVASSMSLT